MNINDVSDEGKYVTFMRHVLAKAERASRRKGQKARDHPDPVRLVWQFMETMEAQSSCFTKSEGQFITSQVPDPYPPSIRPIGELKPMMISEMTLETHHRSRKVFLRVLTPPNRLNAVMAVAEDEEGTAVLLQLFQQPDEEAVPASDYMDPDRVCVVKEPFFKETTDGTYSVRVDHVGDIIWLEAGDERVPQKWRRRAAPASLSQGSAALRMGGNNAVQKQHWSKAERLYSASICAAKTPQEEQLAALNRSLTNLKLGRVEAALQDAIAGTGPGDGAVAEAEAGAEARPSEKGLFRQARALYELGKFQPSLEMFLTLVALYPENGTAKSEAERVKARLREQQRGEYDFGRMYKQASATPPTVDCATYASPVEVRPLPGRGRGLFTTRPVSAGELLVCEKAFGYVYAGDDMPKGQGPRREKVTMNLVTKRMAIGGQVDLLKQIVQKLYHNPGLIAGFADLHRGDYPAVAAASCDGKPVVDTFLVEKIISLNCFGSPRYTRTSFQRVMARSAGEYEKEKEERHSTCGIWLLASHINHSCVANCHCSFIGDMQIIRATKDLGPGVELVFPYLNPESFASYEERREKLRKNWGFTCECPLCLQEKSTSRGALREREALMKNLRAAFRASGGVYAAKAGSLLEKLWNTYPDGEGGAGAAIRMELGDPFTGLGESFLARGKLADAVEMALRGLEAGGFRIVACPPRGGGGGGGGGAAAGTGKRPARLEVMEWGKVVGVVTILAFLTLFRAYKRLAPELCAVAREYVGTAYSIMIGEKETLAEEIPEVGSMCAD